MPKLVTYYTDVRSSKDIMYFTGFDSEGKDIVDEFEYSPYLFEKTETKQKWKTIYGGYAKMKKFSNISSAKSYISKNPDYQGLERWEAQYLGYTFHNNPTIDYKKLRIYAIDIETTAEQFPNIFDPVEKLLCITVVDINNDIVITFSSKKQDFTSEYKNSYYFCYDNETEMIKNFLGWWVKYYPHIVTGWSSSSFDIPYMTERVRRILPSYYNHFSPHKNVYSYKKTDQHGRDVLRTIIYGIQQLDYIELYKKFTYEPRPNYKLDTISKWELGDSKTEHGQFNSFKEFYEGDYRLFLEYNQKDAYLIKRLEEKLCLIKLAVTMGSESNCNFEDCFSPIRIWDSVIFNFLNTKNIVIPGYKESSRYESIVGGRVKDPVPGLYDWIVTFDLTSLYPSIIMALNISPETILEGKEDVNLTRLLKDDYKNTGKYSLGANGAKFDNSREGFLPILVEKKFEERKDYKRKMLKKRQELQDIKAELKKRGLLNE